MFLENVLCKQLLRINFSSEQYIYAIILHAWRKIRRSIELGEGNEVVI